VGGARPFAAALDAVGLHGPQAQAGRGVADVLTPPAMLAVLSAGYAPRWHPSAARE